MAVATNPSERSTGYKQTEVGLLPKDWKIKPLGQVVAKYIDYRGRTPKKLGSEWGGGDILALSANNVQMGYIDETKEAYFGSPALYDRWMVKGDCRRGDVLLTMEAPLGNVAQIPDSRKYILSQRVILIRTSDELVDDYAFHLLSGSYFQNELRKNASGSTAQGIQRQKLDRILVYFPNSSLEQRAIAAVLSDADALILSLGKLIAKKRDLKTAAMQQLLTGKRQLPGYAGRWRSQRLGELLAYEQPTKYLVKSTAYDDSYDMPVLTAGKTFILGYTSEQTGICRDVPVIIFDDFTTASRYVDFPFKAKSSAMKILRPRDDRSNLRFVCEKMQLIDFPLGDHKRYWISEYQKTELPMPCREEQDGIAIVLSDMDSEIAALEARREKARAVKEGMMEELLTGRIRLA